jgi:hypothetical protein
MSLEHGSVTLVQQLLNPLMYCHEGNKIGRPTLMVVVEELKKTSGKE